MNITSLILFLLVGTAAGWLIGSGMRGGGVGLPGNILVGVIGGLAGDFLFRLLGISAGGLIGRIVLAVAGAVVMLYVVDQFKGPKKSLIDY